MSNETQQIVLYALLSGIVCILLAVLHQAWQLYKKLTGRKSKDLCFDLLLNENDERVYWHRMWKKASKDSEQRRERFIRLNWKYRHLVKRHQQLKERHNGLTIHAKNLQIRLDARLNRDARINRNFEADLLLSINKLESFMREGEVEAAYQTVQIIREAIENDLTKKP